jgi:biopolymer transport protein ExbD
MLKKLKRRVGVRIDMTPMVDVAFLLLIFYMSTTIFKPPEKKSVTLPTSHAQVPMPDKNIINITVTKDDSIFIEFIEEVEEGGKKIPSRRLMETGPDDLIVNLNIARGVFWERGQNPIPVIKGDREAKYGLIEQIMKNMKENNLNVFQLVTEFKAEER